MVEGQPFHATFSCMQPRFHPTLEALLQHAFRQGQLDRVLSDILRCYHSCSDDSARLKDLNRLLREYSAIPEESTICHECLWHELSKILQRIQIEQAYEVILHQEGEAFFHHTYLGSKAVRYCEPSHSKTYITLQKTLTDAAQQGYSLVLNNRNWSVTQRDARHFWLSTPAIHVALTFAGWDESP
jgi:hypothetical protein